MTLDWRGFPLLPRRPGDARGGNRNTLASWLLLHVFSTMRGRKQGPLKSGFAELSNKQVVRIVAEVAPLVEGKGSIPIGGWIDSNGLCSLNGGQMVIDFIGAFSNCGDGKASE